MNQTLNALTKEELIELIIIYAKDWLAIDGVWFQSLEREYGMDEAMRHNCRAWEAYAPLEARRLKEFLKLDEHPGLDGLARALKLSLYSFLNKYEIFIDGDTLIYRFLDCRVQTARARKNMPFHPCRPVGLLQNIGFAKTIDDRLTCECLSCFPEITDDTCSCSWKFILNR